MVQFVCIYIHIYIYVCSRYVALHPLPMLRGRYRALWACDSYILTVKSDNCVAITGQSLYLCAGTGSQGPGFGPQ